MLRAPPSGHVLVNELVLLVFFVAFSDQQVQFIVCKMFLTVLRLVDCLRFLYFMLRALGGSRPFEITFVYSLVEMGQWGLVPLAECFIKTPRA